MPGVAALVPRRMTSRREELFERGYLVVPAVVPPALCEAVVAATAAFVGVDPDDPATWYGNCSPGHGIVPLHHGQALWDVRQWPAVHALFRELYEDESLWVSMDRVSCKAPAAGWEGGDRTSPLHWDTDPRRPRRAEFQGLVYLRDTAAEQGAFCCAPDVYAELPKWVSGRRVREARDAVNASATPIRKIGGRAGSMVVWHRQMPHSSARNDGRRPRWVQYVTMDVAGSEDERLERVRLFEERRPPEWAVGQQVPGQLIPEPGPTAKLTPLGRRLVGIDRWESGA